jgi:hypothetical protein
MNWEHDALALDLASHLAGPEQMIWQNMQLGPAGSPRPDVFAVSRRYCRPNPTSYECKISKPDFRADITTGKWRSYLDFSWAVVFAAPDGLISKEDLPEMCGLILRKANTWRLAKKPTIVPRPINQDAFLKLLIDGVSREGAARRRSEWSLEHANRTFLKRFGTEAARYIRDAAAVQDKIASANKRSEKIIARATERAAQLIADAEENGPTLWRELLGVLNLPPTAHYRQVENVISDLRRTQSDTEEARALRDVLLSLRRIVENKKEFLTKEETMISLEVA